MLLSIGDIVVAVTLFVNAGAVLNFKVEQKAAETNNVKGRVLRCIQAMQVLRTAILAWNLVVMLGMLF